MKRLILLSSLFFLCSLGSAQTGAPKREFRAAWVASVTNLDFPTARGLSVDSLQKQITTMFTQLRTLDTNVVIFQVRSECDALYKSPYEPWSYWLTGQQGKAPEGDFDPLAFAIDEAHKRGMELHAWFNPYRAERAVGNYTLDTTHVVKAHPNWILTFGITQTVPQGTLKMLDPGIPDARNHIARVMADVVRRYNVDGIHWDDYFYPYAPNSITNQDAASFAANNPTGLALADWRRNNVNTLVKMVADSVAALKPWVKFGISPFGIWKSGVPSGIVGTSAYSELYCDAPYWMQQHYLDYLTPQLYWPFGGGQDYGKLMPWWASQMNGRDLYPGQAAYRIPSWTSVSEAPNQIRLNRSTLNPSGSVFFRARQGLLDNPKGFADSLRNNFYKYPALIPAMTWKDSIPPLAPVSLTAKAANPPAAWLKWQKPGKASDGDTARYFVIYRFSSPDSVNLDDARAIRSITSNDTTEFIDNAAYDQMTYTYAVTAVDKLHNESAPAIVTLRITGVQDLANLTPQEFRLEQNYPNPFNPSTTIRFYLNTREHASVKVFDLLGREVATLVEGELEAGAHTYRFSGEKCASGVYMYRIIAGANVASKRMILQK